MNLSAADLTCFLHEPIAPYDWLTFIYCFNTAVRFVLPACPPARLPARPRSSSILPSARPSAQPSSSSVDEPLFSKSGVSFPEVFSCMHMPSHTPPLSWQAERYKPKLVVTQEPEPEPGLEKLERLDCSGTGGLFWKVPLAHYLLFSCELRHSITLRSVQLSPHRNLTRRTRGRAIEVDC